MKSLLKEFANRGDTQQDLKTSDGSDAGNTDTAKNVDVRFNMMRNIINTQGGVSGSDVNDYLERAHELNDEVDTVGFAIETDDGDYIKVYVNAQQADEFEQELSKMLGLDDDSESAINTLAQKFDIVDVVWPNDPAADGENAPIDPYADATIDDDPSSFMDDETETTADAETETETDTADTGVEDDANLLPADDEGEGKSKESGSLMKDVAARAKSKVDDDDENTEETPPADDVDADDEVVNGSGDGEEESEKKDKKDDAAAAPVDDVEADVDTDSEGEGPETVDADATAEVDADAEVDATADADDESDEGDSEELDAEGNPIKKKKKKKAEDGSEVTEEGLKSKSLLASIAESVRDEVNAHVASATEAAKNLTGKFYIETLETGGLNGRREGKYTKNGQVVYFDTIEEASARAEELHRIRNHTLAKAAFTYTPKIVEEDMSIGSKFLQRVTEAAAPAAGGEIKGDAVWTGLQNRMKRPYEKKIVELFYLLGIPGRYVRGEEGLEDGIRAGGDIIRRAGRKQTLFNQFFDAIKGAGAGAVTEKKAGSRVQKTLETVLVVLGFPESLVTTENGGALLTVMRRIASKIEQSDTAEAALIGLAKALGVTTAQVNEEIDVGQDEFSQTVMGLVLALGIPEGILAPRRAMIIKALREKKMSLTNRPLIEQRMQQLVTLIAKGTREKVDVAHKDMDRMQEALQEGLVMEAFSPLEACVGRDLEHFNAEEPAAGPAMMASYEGGAGAHDDTVLMVAVDPEADNEQRALRVGIDGPWDGSIHAKYFANNEEGYKKAIAYANMLRTVTLKTGGRPKGWKDTVDTAAE